MHLGDVLTAPYERQRDHVRAGAQRPAQVVRVLAGERGDGDGDAGEVDALVVGDHAPLDDEGVDAGPFHGGDFEGHLAVVHEDAVPGVDVRGQSVVRGPAEVAVPLHRVHGEGELVAPFQQYGSVAEHAQPDLRALEVGEHADAAAGLVAGFPYVPQTLLVLGVRPVAEVEARDVHPGLDQGFDLVVRVRGGSQCADDFRSAHSSSVRLTVR